VTASPHRLALLLAAAFAGVWLGAAGLTAASARLPNEASGWVLVLFPPGLGSAAAAARIVDAEGLPSEPFGAAFAWTAYSPAAGFAGRLKDQGAMLVIPLLGGLRFASICGGGMELLSRADTTASDP
jgi:hypothetical protein